LSLLGLTSIHPFKFHLALWIPLLKFRKEMDVAWSRNQVELGDALARSPHSLHSGSSRRRRHGSSGRASDSSFVTSMDGGADLISLEWALSNSAGSDAEFNDWNLNFDALSASPTSNGTPDNEHYMSSNGNSAHAPRSFDAGFTSNGGLPIDQSTNISRSAFQANPARNAPPTDQTFLPLVDSHSYAVSGGLPGWPDEHRYNFQYIPPPNNPRYGRTRRTPVSASSLATNGSIHEPWSPESHPRYNRIPSADVNMFGPASDNLEPYASSVHSHNSLDSPLFSFNPTPSPARSPIPAQAEPFKSLSLMSERQLSNCSSLSGVSPTDQTPRPRQTAFPHAEQSRRPFTATDVKPSPRLLTENTSQTISIDNTHSPTSDFVLVDSATDIQSSPSPKPIKRKASEVEEAHEFETVFIRHIFSPDQDYSLNHEAHLARKRVNGNRVGGRATGSHLNAQSAARARELREKGSCWICCLQRDSVSAAGPPS
jgi:hypothetical protein